MFSQVNASNNLWAPATDQPVRVEDAAAVALWTVFDNNGANSFEIVFDTNDYSDTFDAFITEEKQDILLNNDGDASWTHRT
ncbi:MAG: hypothetical protein K2X93_25810 [Candidatus Obscuribacterales bacterium]|nr:hypothetical protein [Candidatus Obscuribacterales bacterium]